MQATKAIRILVFMLLGMFSIAPGASAREGYYVLIFGSQSQPKLLKYTHTWATFVRAVGEGSDANQYNLYVHTISWLPQTLDVHVWRARPEQGVNLTLEQTLQTVFASNQQVTMWGPFLITPELYVRSIQIYNLLQTGAVQYRAISTSANMLISDCIHAVAAVDPIFGRQHYPLIRIGIPASRFMAREVMVRSLERRGFDQAAFDNSWLIPRLGLNRYPITFVPPQQIPPRSCVLCRVPE